MTEQQFIELCETGNLDELKHLLEANPTINISAQNQCAFRWACYYGHLEVAQWLLQVSKETGRQTINISAGNEYVFECVCTDEWAFRRPCSGRHLLVAQWLQSLKPYLYVIYYNEDSSYKGYYIRYKEEERWEKRKLLVWLASDLTPCKKNLLYRIPEDVSRYIISNYL